MVNLLFFAEFVSIEYDLHGLSKSVPMTERFFAKHYNDKRYKKTQFPYKSTFFNAIFGSSLKFVLINPMGLMNFTLQRIDIA